MKHTAKSMRALWRFAGAFGLAGLLLLGCGTAWANVNIAVNNPSFETLPGGGLPFTSCGVGCSYSIDSIPGWTNSGNTGQFRPGSSSGNLAYFNYVPDGITVAYSNGGTISQTVGATVQAGVIYTLSVELGNRSDNGGGYANQGSADLLINGHQYVATGVEAALGTWTTWTAYYTGTIADAGKSITIELNALAPQGNYDNVSLSATPEPGFYGALALGMSGLLVAIQRRRRA
jgi:hypothetical protein